VPLAPPPRADEEMAIAVEDAEGHRRIVTLGGPSEAVAPA
jgi:hypothetical protein